MVLREQCINRVEGERVTLVDSWEAYVVQPPMATLRL
jgi:hypothetical protein